MSLFDRILDVVYPPRCAGCNETMYPYESPLCSICTTKWEIEKKLRCPKCGREHIKCRCGLSVDSGKVIADTVHLCGYSAKINSVPKNVVITAKQLHDSRLFEFLAKELSPLVTTLRNFNTDNCLITYVPRSPANRRQDGMDQSERLAKAISVKLDIPFANTLKHLRFRRIQKELNASGRIENSLKSYKPLRSAEELVAGKNIILIDDVVTTGASVFACACILTGCGAASVSVASVCRTI